MGIFDRIRRIVRSEVTAARGNASDAWESQSFSDFGSSSSNSSSSSASSSSSSRSADDDEATDPIARAYARLEAEEGADFATVKKAYRTVMKRYHPDRHSSDPDKVRIANEVAAALTDAYDTLEKHLT